MNNITSELRGWFGLFAIQKNHRLPLLLAFLTGVLAYAIFIFHHLMHDHGGSMPWIDPYNFFPFGRWTSILIYVFGYFADIPVFNPLIGLLLLVLSAYYVFLILSYKEARPWEVYLFVSLVITFPMNLSCFFYTFSTLITTASIFFAVMAACSCRQGTWVGGILGFVFLLLMWTTYQASMGVFLVALGTSFLAEFLKKSIDQNVADTTGRNNLIRPFVASAFALFASVVIYAVAFKFIAGGIRHASSIGLQELPSLWVAVIQSAFDHLWKTQPDFHRSIKLILFLVVCLAFLGSLWRCHRNWSRFFLLLLLWPCCLLATKAIFFLIKTDLPFYEYRLNVALSFFYAFAFWVLLFIARQRKWVYSACAILACFTLIRFVQADLVRQIVNKRGETHDLALANRLLSRIEALEGLDPSKTYQLVRIGNGNNLPYFRRTLLDAGGRNPDESGDGHMDWGFITNHWVPDEVFKYLGSNVKLVYDDFPSQKRVNFAVRYLLENRQPYPAKSSVFLLGDTIYVYLSKPAVSGKPLPSKTAISATKEFVKVSEDAWRFQKMADFTTPCWTVILQEIVTKNRTFVGSLILTTDRDIKIQALLCSHDAPYEGTSVNYQVKAGDPLEIIVSHKYKADSPAVKFQLNITSAPEESVNLKVENVQIVENP